jgi:hypothetical protein
MQQQGDETFSDERSLAAARALLAEHNPGFRS